MYQLLFIGKSRLSVIKLEIRRRISYHCIDRLWLWRMGTVTIEFELLRRRMWEDEVGWISADDVRNLICRFLKKYYRGWSNARLYCWSHIRLWLSSECERVWWVRRWKIRLTMTNRFLWIDLYIMCRVRSREMWSSFCRTVIRSRIIMYDAWSRDREIRSGFMTALSM